MAVLEILVHLDLPLALIPSDYRLLTIETPDDAVMERLDAPPADADACRRIGDDFLARSEALILSVPSVVVPQEHNLLINPRRQDARRLRLLDVKPFAFDPRLIG